VARAERLAARLLGGVEYRPRGLVGGGAARVKPGIVVAKPKRRRVGEAAGLGDLARAERPPGHRRLDALARGGRRVAGQADLDLGIAGERPRRPGQGVAERFERIVAIGHARA
jgi:hypothetical protein